MANWQPIETAPFEPDGRFLVYTEGEIVIGYRNCFYDGNPWWQCEDEGPVNWGAIKPTHWMPLPSPPAADEGHSDENK
ncbi:MAG: DUF551 domain-containing protein [Sphingomonas sp.]|nr:DUF551 domain-containing protein [Sphingomonas sp.]